MNVNLDVLELVFAQLTGSDLAAAALVSRAFLAGAIPSLYSHIEYTPRHAKRDHDFMSPFATLAAHDRLVVHVKRIAVHAAPLFHPVAQQPNPAFVHDLARALAKANNLRSFVCTVKILPALLETLADKQRLSHLRICADLGSRQIPYLQRSTRLQSLALDFPSWTVVDILPKWTAGMQKTLTHLTLYGSQYMDVSVLNNTLAQLPHLRGLHVIGCLRITHVHILKALSHTPDLRELSLSLFPAHENVLPPLNFSIPPLTHLSIDVRASYSGLQPLIARIIRRLSPRDALAICGGWIGEIKGSSERTDPPQSGGPPNTAGEPEEAGTAGGGGGGHFHFFGGHLHLPDHGQGHGHGYDQHNDPPLLSPPNPHHGNANANQNAGAPPNHGNQGPAGNFMSFTLPIPPGNPSSNDDNDPPGGDPADPNTDANWPSLVSSLPSSLSVLHLPQISPAGLKEVVDHCQGLQLLGIVIGSAFATLASIKSSRNSNRPSGRGKSHSLKAVGVRPEVNALASVLARARALRELIIDVSATTEPSVSDGRSGQGQYALLTPTAVRMLMRESPHLRRIVAEGRVWESPTPIPSSPVPFPRCLDIDLTLAKARYGPGTGNNHTHGPPGFGTHGGRYGQLEASNDHWFWLADSASAGKVYSEF